MQALFGGGWMLATKLVQCAAGAAVAIPVYRTAPAGRRPAPRARRGRPRRGGSRLAEVAVALVALAFSAAKEPFTRVAGGAWDSVEELREPDWIFFRY